MKLVKLSADDGFVRFALRRYLAKFRIPDVEQDPEKSWWGLTDSYEEGGAEYVVLAFAYVLRADGGMDLTDLYVDPNKRGMKALAYAAKALKAALAGGAFPYTVGSTFAKNRHARRWLKTFFGKPNPDALTFILPGATLDDERRAILA